MQYMECIPISLQAANGKDKERRANWKSFNWQKNTKVKIENTRNRNWQTQIRCSKETDIKSQVWKCLHIASNERSLLEQSLFFDLINWMNLVLSNLNFALTKFNDGRLWHTVGSSQVLISSKILFHSIALCHFTTI